jgi:outer membrane protease
MRRWLCIFGLSLALAPAFALSPTLGHADERLLTSADGAVVFRGSYGISFVKANELVYQGKDKVSQLIWQSTAVSTFTGEVKVDFDKFFVRATGMIGVAGNGHMVDFDWGVPGNDWTDRSQHPDTRLNHYFSGSIEAGREVLNLDGTAVTLAGGIKYTDIKWSAFGGSYVYSSFRFRDTRGSFPDNQKGISYQQQWPVPFIGVDLARSEGKWTFLGSLKGGVAVNGTGTDDHWVRNLRFIDRINATAAVMASASAEYEVRQNTAVFVSGSFDRIFHARGDTDLRDRSSGYRQTYKNSAGADFMSGTISLGLRGKF